LVIIAKNKLAFSNLSRVAPWKCWENIGATDQSWILFLHIFDFSQILLCCFYWKKLRNRFTGESM